MFNSTPDFTKFKIITDGKNYNPKIKKYYDYWNNSAKIIEDVYNDNNNLGGNI